MWPLAYYLNLQLYGHEPLPLNRLVIWMHVPFIMAFATFAISKRIYNMERDAQQARDLGSYKLVSLIGSGGMGDVWRARHHMLARDAAIKRFAPGAVNRYQPEITRKRFKREAQAIASLQSPHTVYLFDFGISQEGSFYYVMELLDGISLEVLVGKFGPQQAPRVVHILRQACESLEEAHRRGLVHRDIKPSNIFACNVGIEYDFVKVLDFGLVKDVCRRKRSTSLFRCVGTPAYIALKSRWARTTSTGVDIHGLGCIAYFADRLAGLEKNGDCHALAHAKAPVPLAAGEIQIAARLEAILRCLAKRPEDRPQSARELNDLLAAAGVPEWTQEKASEWWQTYLPESSSYRMARQTRAAEPVLLQET
jgi:serine/threonine-protein kinase